MIEKINLENQNNLENNPEPEIFRTEIGGRMGIVILLPKEEFLGLAVVKKDLYLGRLENKKPKWKKIKDKKRENFFQENENFKSLEELIQKIIDISTEKILSRLGIPQGREEESGKIKKIIEEELSYRSITPK